MNLNRRSFLAGSLAATAGLAAPRVAASRVAASRVLGANDTIRVGVMGCGIRGRHHIDRFARQSGVSVSLLPVAVANLHLDIRSACQPPLAFRANPSRLPNPLRLRRGPTRRRSRRGDVDSSSSSPSTSTTTAQYTPPNPTTWKGPPSYCLRSHSSRGEQGVLSGGFLGWMPTSIPRLSPVHSRSKTWLCMPPQKSWLLFIDPLIERF